tara:strand:- start:2215 stop:2853 length:639 start_codon:yes stop_codon:yes gene_type:complete
MNVRFSVNGPALHKEITRSMRKRNNANDFEQNVKADRGELLKKAFQKMKKEMIVDFLNIPITKEIMSGPGSSNISGTLGGYGDLFSFIGFDRGDDPIGPILNLLYKSNCKFGRMDASNKFKISIEIPTAEQIFDITPLPWAPGISWAKRMEIGLSGLGTFLSKESEHSRSGKGVQSKNQIRKGTFSNTQYISHFINNWNKKFIDLIKGGGFK